MQVINNTTGHNYLNKCLKTVQINNIHDTILSEFLNFLEINFKNYECNINFILEKLNISYDCLNYKTLKFFGMTPKRLLENLRLDYSLFLLQNSTSVIQTSINCGYNSIRSFQKSFKRRFDICPVVVKEYLQDPQQETQLILILIDKLWRKNDV